MKRCYPLLLFVFCMACRRGASLRMEKDWQSWLDQKEYFRLRNSMDLHKYDVSPEKSLYFRCFIDNVFNMNAASIQDISALMEGYNAQRPNLPGHACCCSKKTIISRPSNMPDPRQAPACRLAQSGHGWS